MRSLQFRLTCRVALVSMAAAVLVLVVLNLYAIHRLTQQSKKYLKGIARSVAEMAIKAGVPQQPVPPGVAASIEEHLAFIDSERNLAAAILTEDGQEVFRSTRFDVVIGERLRRGDRTQLILQGVGSGAKVEDLLSVWRYVYRHRERGLVVFVSDAHHFELAERLVESIGVAFLVAMVLAIPAGYLISRRILRPFHAIDTAAARIRRGDLKARIDLVERSPELNRLIGALNDTFAELEASFGRIQQFSADAAHELNTPLTALRGNLEVCLAKERTAEDYQAVLGESVEEVSRLSSMVRDLLLLASPGGADRRAYFQSVAVLPVIHSTLERLGFIAEESGIRLVCTEVGAVTVHGDAALLQRALYNLVHNAIRYSPPNTQVEVAASQQDRQVVIEVRDQGIGIPAEECKLIFERFYRLDAGRTSGAGLGLSLVKWIVELHHGLITVDSDRGRGSTFRIVLPNPENAQA